MYLTLSITNRFVLNELYFITNRFVLNIIFSITFKTGIILNCILVSLVKQVYLLRYPFYHLSNRFVNYIFYFIPSKTVLYQLHHKCYHFLNMFAFFIIYLTISQKLTLSILSLLKQVSYNIHLNTRRFVSYIIYFITQHISLYVTLSILSLLTGLYL